MQHTGCAVPQQGKRCYCPGFEGPSLEATTPGKSIGGCTHKSPIFERYEPCMMDLPHKTAAATPMAQGGCSQPIAIKL